MLTAEAVMPHLLLVYILYDGPSSLMSALHQLSIGWYPNKDGMTLMEQVSDRDAGNVYVGCSSENFTACMMHLN